MDLRETRGLAYDVSSSINHFRDCGSMVVYCGVEPRKTKDAVSAVMHQLDGMRVEAEERELHKAREYATGRLLLRMEDSRAVASWMGSQELLQDQLCSVEEIVGRLQAVTPADISQPGHATVPAGPAAPRAGRPSGWAEDADLAAQAITKRTPYRLKMESPSLGADCLVWWQSAMLNPRSFLRLPLPGVPSSGILPSGYGPSAPCSLSRFANVHLPAFPRTSK